MEILVLRLIHILGGIAWVGGGIFAAFFLIPAIVGTPAMPQVMEGLQRRRLFVFTPIFGLLTVLTGIRLLWIDSAGFDDSYMATGPGRTFSIGGTAALIAFLLQVFISRPAGVKLGALATKMSANPPAEERQLLTAEIEKLRKRNGMATMGAVSLGILAAAAMALARYM
jgi:uncharacterized membrane protein